MIHGNLKVDLYGNFKVSFIPNPQDGAVQQIMREEIR